MELELREQLCGGDEELWIAWAVYELDAAPENFERAAAAVLWQIRDGLIELLDASNAPPRVVALWKARQVLAERANWRRAAPAKYLLRLAPEGARQI